MGIICRKNTQSLEKVSSTNYSDLFFFQNEKQWNQISDKRHPDFQLSYIPQLIRMALTLWGMSDFPIKIRAN